jgi:hypothetical protein
VYHLDAHHLPSADVAEVWNWKWGGSASSVPVLPLIIGIVSADFDVAIPAEGRVRSIMCVNGESLPAVKPHIQILVHGPADAAIPHTIYLLSIDVSRRIVNDSIQQPRCLDCPDVEDFG